MDKFWSSFMDKVRDFRSQKFGFVGKFLLEHGISANIMTSLSLIFGIIAVYFLFDEYWLFFLFALLHYLADGLDGIIARIGGATDFGKYFDYFVDRLTELLLLVKIWLLLEDYYVLIVIALFLVAQSIYLISKFQLPVLFTRSFLLLFAALSPLGMVIFPTLGYLTAGVAALYSLALQVRTYLGAGNF